MQKMYLANMKRRNDASYYKFSQMFSHLVFLRRSILSITSVFSYLKAR
jgi:hypothetical protein